jgi:hypothetical protein
MQTRLTTRSKAALTAGLALFVIWAMAALWVTIDFGGNHPPRRLQVEADEPAPRVAPARLLPEKSPQLAFTAQPDVQPVRAASLDETALMAQLRAIGQSDPATAIELARQGNAEFPDSPEAAERAWFVAKNLVNLGRFDQARAEARSMLERYPGTSWTNDVERHLLTHPR